MIISIYGKVPTNPQDKDLIVLLLEDLSAQGIDVLVWKPFYDAIKDLITHIKGIETFTKKSEIDKHSKILFSLGGDGTMLDTLDYVIGTDIAVIGINLGHLGFLTTAGRSDIKTIVKEIVAENYTIEKRPVLKPEYSFDCSGREFAFNEVCFLSTNRGSVVDLEVFINDKYASTFCGDGLIIATPTGSTAYSMSAGGPIITPDSRCLCVTPIAPHNLTFRPIIISDDDVVKVRIPDTEDPCKMLVDGYAIFDRTQGEITIRKSRYSWNLVRLKNQDFFFSIRNKLMWGQTPKFLTGNL